MLAKLLLIDDDPLSPQIFSYACGVDYQMHAMSQPVDAIRWLWRSGANPEIVFVRLDPPRLSYAVDEALGLIRYLSSLSSCTRLIALCESEDWKARKALALGAHAAFPKPTETKQLAGLIRRQVVPTPRIARTLALERLIVGDSAVCETLRAQIEQYAALPFPVLITGESGAGKDLIARGLHLSSNQAKEPFLTVNCAAIAPSLFESLLFGHSKGAFTGASSAKAGLLEEAGGGTLFLDEIGELPLTLQAKLLRVLEDGAFFRVGESQRRMLKARVVAATNRNLSDQIRQGGFRLDLYYRLSVLTIHAPSLAQRPEDKLQLWNHYAERISKELGVRPCRLTSEAQVLWERYAFPGNVRELKNMVIRLHSKFPGEEVDYDRLKQETNGQVYLSVQSRSADLALAISADDALDQPDFHLDRTLRRCEETLIRSALDRADSNIAAAAKLLGLSRTTLYGRLDRLKISSNVSE